MKKGSPKRTARDLMKIHEKVFVIMEEKKEGSPKRIHRVFFQSFHSKIDRFGEIKEDLIPKEEKGRSIMRKEDSV